MKRYETLERQLCSSRSAALVPPPFRPAVGSHAPAARRMTAIPVSRLRPPNVSILFGVAAPPAEDDARAIDDRARASPSCLLVELALRPGETSPEGGGGRVTLAQRACAPRWEYLFRLDAREAATSRGVVTVLDTSVRFHRGGCVLARVELPTLFATGGGLPATRVDPPVAPASVACPSPSRLHHLVPSPAAPLWVDRAEALVRDPPRALALSRVAQLLLLLDVCAVVLFVLFVGSSRRRRRSRVEMEDDLADDVDAPPETRETRAGSRAASPTATLPISPSSLSLSSFSSSSERGTTALARAEDEEEEEEVFPRDDDPPSPSFLPTATPPRWNIVDDVDAPCDPRERRDWCISAVVRGDLAHGGVDETDLVTAFLAAPPRPCGWDRNLDPNVEAAAAEDRDASFEDDEDAGASSADDEDGLLCREARVVVPVPANEKSRLARRRRQSRPFRLRMWGRSMPGATARLLLRDLSRCAQFAGATMRTFAPGTFESPTPRLPLSVAPAASFGRRQIPETAASAPAGVATIGSAAAAARGGGRGGWAAAMRQFAAAAAPPATAADAADATDLFRDGWEGSRRDSKGRLAR